jgi:restriction system protein
VLKLLSETDKLKLKEFEAPIAKFFMLNDNEVSQEYESGNGKVLYDRISWALSYLNMAGLVQKPRRGMYQISPTGLQQLKTPDELNGYIAEKIAKRRSSANKKRLNTPLQEQTPDEELEASYLQICEAIYDDILDTILSKSSREFEKLVVELLQKMGYGGEVKTAGQVTQYANDKGIDGIIKEDVLGLGRIYIQAKRYARDNTIARQDVQKFVGALAVAQSNKGVFINTSRYSKGAIEYADNLNGTTTLILIDGVQLAQYIYDYNLGVKTKKTIKIKALDGDYWDNLDDE